MENKLIIGIIASVIIGLTSWNLKETYEISKTIVLLKEKVREEILKGTTKDRILSKEDAKLMKNFLQKLQKEIYNE